MMFKRVAPFLTICLVAATSAQAQSGGGHGHGGSGRGGPPPGGSASVTPGHKPPKPFSEPEIVGVIKAIDLDTGRLTISYEAVDALDWPAGTQPFAVSKTALLKDMAVGEKVRFKLESQQISAIRPF